MKVCKIFKKYFQPSQVKNVTQKVIPPCPIVYDSKNVTEEEFKTYVHWLAENNINKTFYEPDKFITQAEREALEKQNAEIEEYRKFVRHLAKNNINKTFYC